VSFWIPVYDYRQDEITAWVELPDDELWVCGSDFCDQCGDCLACYGSDPCYNNPDAEHTYVIYPNNLTEFMTKHPQSTLIKEPE
jgi:hypothetical protein